MKEKSTYWKDAIGIWFDFYRHKTGQDYIFDGVQGKHLKMLLNKVKAKITQKGMEPTEENILNSFKGFLSHLNDSWILEHLEISIINSKFNVIYAKAINAGPIITRKQQSDKATRDSVEQHYRDKLAERGFSNAGNQKSG